MWYTRWYAGNEPAIRRVLFYGAFGVSVLADGESFPLRHNKTASRKPRKIRSYCTQRVSSVAPECSPESAMAIRKAQCRRTNSLNRGHISGRPWPWGDIGSYFAEAAFNERPGRRRKRFELFTPRVVEPAGLLFCTARQGYARLRRQGQRRADYREPQIARDMIRQPSRQRDLGC